MNKVIRLEESEGDTGVKMMFAIGLKQGIYNLHWRSVHGLMNTTIRRLINIAFINSRS
jgi:hypothetical protein